MSSRSSALVITTLGLAACNQVFGSTSVEVTPVAQFDAPLDAAFACTAIGQTPQFSPYLHQFLARDCSFYGIAGTDAVAECMIAGVETVVIGPLGGELVPALGLPASGLPSTPRIAPDGQTMLGRVNPAVVEYARAGDVWSVANSNVFELGSTGTPFSSIAQIGSTLRVLVLEFPEDTLAEYERANGVWSVVAQTPVEQVVGSASPALGLALTSDGLRLVIATDSETRYSDRPSLDAAFRPSEPLQSPAASDVFVSDDCARIYLSGLGSVFYAQRL